LQTADISHAATVAEVIASDFYDDRLDLSARDVVPGSTWSRMPEVECVARLRDLGASDRSVRLFLTFIAAMNRARDAVRLWHSGVELFQSYPELFEPDEASAMPVSTIRERLSQSGVSQRHRPDSCAWNTIAHSLAAGGNPVSRAVDSGEGHAEELLRYLRSSCGGQSRFPLLRGPKIGPMWVRMLVDPGGAKIGDIDNIPVAVDVHVCRVTKNLGLLDIQNVSVEKNRQEIQEIWRTAINTAKVGGPPELRGTCAALDPALWIFGKYGCKYCEKVAEPVPISRACEHCQLGISNPSL